MSLERIEPKVENGGVSNAKRGELRVIELSNNAGWWPVTIGM